MIFKIIFKVKFLTGGLYQYLVFKNSINQYFFSFSTGIVEIISGPSLNQPTALLVVYNTEIYRHP